MPNHPTPNADDDRTRLGGLPRAIAAGLTVVGLTALAVGLAVGWSQGDRLRQFLASYLVSYMFFLSISLGALCFVALQHLVRAGWSVTVRRLAEILAANLFPLGILFLPILVCLWLGWAGPYAAWLDPQQTADAPLSEGKQAYLSLPFFTIRAAVYLVLWAVLGWFFLRLSTRQDASSDPGLTRRMETASPLALILFGLTITFAAFDWLMSIEPLWFSTIFGLYYFAGAIVAALGAMILFAAVLQRGGLVLHTITTEHYHELGKLLLGFVIFWGYMAFSQYMLIWYANIPEENVWYLARQTGPWAWVSVGLLFGNLLIPFLGLLPRTIKRHKALLGVWAVWLLVFHWIDMYWLVMPALTPGSLPLGAVDLCCFVAIGCLFLAGVVWTALGRALTPLGDPRRRESLAFENA